MGVVAYKPLTRGIAEMKRLYVAPEGRGFGSGSPLSHRRDASRARGGHKRMVLDTLPRLVRAMAIYRELGFAEVPRYNDNPEEGVVFLGLNL